MIGYNNPRDPQEWNNLANDGFHSIKKHELDAFLPKNEAPLVKTGIALWNVNDADRPERMDSFKKKSWPQMKKKLKPSIE